MKSAAEDHRVSEEKVGEGPGGQKMVQAYAGGKQPPHSESDVWHRPGGAKSANDKQPRQRGRDCSDTWDLKPPFQAGLWEVLGDFNVSQVINPATGRQIHMV